MKIKHVLVVLSAIFSTPALSQQSQIKYEVEAQAIGTTNDAVPFWMRSNQFGSIPLNGVSGSFIGRVHKEYNNAKTGILDWGAGFEGRANAGKDSKLLLIEGYVKAKAGVFQLKAGRTKDVMGLTGDTSLTSGSFAISGNALGIPKIEISIPDYYTIPVWDGLISFKGTFAHGWLGRIQILDTISGLPGSGVKYATLNNKPATYFHQKSFYGRIGKPSWRLKLYGGFSHQVFWGNEKESMGEEFDLSKIETFFYVTTGKAYGSGKIPRSKIGNQLGSIDIGLEYDFSSLKIMLYRQNFYDVGALAKLANIRDGLNGITLENKTYHYSPANFRWKKLLFEFLYTKNQAGESWSKPTKSGDEDYYNNYYYRKGWSYNDLGLGTPFITPKHFARQGQASNPNDYFINNRIIAFHGGAEVEVADIEIVTKLSFSQNFGTFGTSPEGNSTGVIRNPNTTNLFKKVNQFSAYIEANKSLTNGLRLGIMGASDQGMLLDNSLGLGFKVSKSF